MTTMHINNTIKKRNAAFLASFLMSWASVAIHAEDQYKYEYTFIRSVNKEPGAKLSFSVNSFKYNEKPSSKLYLPLVNELLNKGKTGDQKVHELRYLTEKKNDKKLEVVKKVKGKDNAFEDTDPEIKNSGKQKEVVYFTALEIFNYLAKKDDDKSKRIKEAIAAFDEEGGDQDASTNFERKFKEVYNKNIETEGKDITEKIFSLLVYKTEGGYKMHFFESKGKKLEDVIDGIAEKDEKVKNNNEIFYLAKDFTLKSIGDSGDNFDQIKDKAKEMDDKTKEEKRDVFKAQGLLWKEMLKKDGEASVVYTKIEEELTEKGKIDKLNEAVKAAMRVEISDNKKDNEGRDWKKYAMYGSIAAVLVIGTVLGFMYFTRKDEEKKGADKSDANKQDNKGEEEKKEEVRKVK